MIKRPLTFEEHRFLQAALEFFNAHGPKQVVVADHGASYPDDPKGKHIKWADTFDYVKEIKEVLEEGPLPAEELQSGLPSDDPAAQYLGMLQVHLNGEQDDLYDMLALIKALNHYSARLASEARQYYHEQEKRLHR